MADKNNKNTQANFETYRGKLNTLYKDEHSLRSKAGKKNTGSKNKRYLTDAKVAADTYANAVSNPLLAATVSSDFFNYDGNYNSLIHFLSELMYIRYTIVPVLNVKPNTKHPREQLHSDKDEYEIMYNGMVSAVDGINLEIVLPHLAKTCLIRGKVYIITEKNTSSGTITTTILPDNYCVTVATSQFGIDIFAFDFKYFDDLKTTMQDNPNAVKDTTNSLFDEVVAAMPKALQEGYQLYLKDKTKRYQTLDGRFAAAFSFEETQLPPKLAMIKSAVEYNKFKENELRKSDSELEKIFVQQVPTNSDGDMIMDLPEILELDEATRRALSGAKNLRTMTAIGKTDLYSLMETKDRTSSVVDIAYDQVFNAVGTNRNMFYSDKDLIVSIQKEKAFMYNFYTKVIQFYNVAVNNFFNYKPYQASINLLPISIYDEDKMMDFYITNAGVGIGRLQAVVASGIKQSELVDVVELENYLNLDKILKPLQSMHTTSHKPANKAGGVGTKQSNREQAEEEDIDSGTEE